MFKQEASDIISPMILLHHPGFNPLLDFARVLIALGGYSLFSLLVM
ncbi:MAG: hypothetical protein KAT53_05720 [Dehalococcoidia bacterium]|nr:hypothetical protein [Dehalococcoidia bacterium]